MQTHQKGTGGPPRRIVVRAGDRYGAWTVLAEVPSADGRRVRCRCSCGQEGILALGSLRAGKTSRCTSCEYQSRRRTKA